MQGGAVSGAWHILGQDDCGVDPMSELPNGSPEDLRELHRRTEARLLELDGVWGVEIASDDSGQQVMKVWLRKDPELSKIVQEIARAATARGIRLEMNDSDEFRALLSSEDDDSEDPQGH